MAGHSSSGIRSRITDAVNAVDGARFLALSGPFFLVFISDILIGRRDYDWFASETLGYFFGTGVGLLYSDWSELYRFMGHNPAIFLTEFSAIFHAIAGLPDNDFSSFRSFAVSVNVVVVLASAAWGSALSHRLGISVMPLLASSALIATMPAVIAWSPSFIGYSTYGVLLLPTSLGICAVAERSHTNDRSVTATYWMIGFLLSVQHLTVILIAAFLLAWLAVWGKSGRLFTAEGFDRERPDQTVSISVKVAVFVFVLVCFSTIAKVAQWAMAKSALFGGVPVSIGPAWLCVLCAPFAFICTILVLRSQVCRRLLHHGIGKGLLGWAVGVNVFAFVWPFGLLSGITTKGGAARPDMSFADKILQLDVGSFLQANPWHFLIPILLVIGVCASVLSRTSKTDDGHRDLFVGVFITILVGLNVVAAMEVSLIDNVERCFQCDRYYNTVIAAIPLSLIWLGRISRHAGRIAVGLTFVATALSVFDYTKVVVPLTQDAWRLNAEVTKIVEAHLAESPDNEVFCDSSYLPDACNVASAFWMLSLRDPRSAARIGADRRVHLLRQDWENAALDEAASIHARAASRSSRATLLILGRPLTEQSSRSVRELLKGRSSTELLNWSMPEMQHRVSPPLFLRVLYLTPVSERIRGVLGENHQSPVPS